MRYARATVYFISVIVPMLIIMTLISFSLVKLFTIMARLLLNI